MGSMSWDRVIIRITDLLGQEVLTVDDLWKTWECNCTDQPSNTTSPVDLYMKDTPKVMRSERDRGEDFPVFYRWGDCDSLDPGPSTLEGKAINGLITSRVLC